MARATIVVALLVVALGVASAQEAVGLTLQFDNRGSKVSDPKKAAQILAAIADCVCNVPPSSVKYSGTIGQSTLLNHQSVSSFQCSGPTKGGKSLLDACKSNTKDGWFSSSNAKKCIKKYTDTWAVGDSVKLQQANCVEVKTAAARPAPVAAPAATSAAAKPATAAPTQG
ncbi:hypothetical protein Rsub_11605 [Raphidocelis subcapitata]|uniref:Uncharacterized protein n=1 Tax=Raphidocelis subcapitata TaxID=307507 RepID=A0A2V0PLV3_9CHLO|nr:hypothetical protein Rsub_11605 [Raphidocelis subcapitata]|eukprot:GBF98840.1 hypothetical protein Rsub_11605 [Raphidocelis subcapitata]